MFSHFASCRRLCIFICPFTDVFFNLFNIDKLNVKFLVMPWDVLPLDQHAPILPYAETYSMGNPLYLIRDWDWGMRNFQ